MGIVFGFLALLCFCLLAGKGLTRKLQMKKADRFFMKMHKPLCVIFLISSCLHILFIIPVISMRNIWVLLMGVTVMILFLLILILCHTIKNKKVKFQWHRILSIIAVLVIACHVVAYSIDFKSYRTRVKDIQLQGMDASELQDGKYVGTCEVGYISAVVEVSIKGGNIEQIQIKEHRNERGKAAERIVDEIIKEQTTDVDAVAGATNSSNVIKRAVEDAMQVWE